MIKYFTKALENSELTDAIVRMIPGGIAGFKKIDGTLLFANEQYFSLIGYSQEEYAQLDVSWDDLLVCLEDRERVRQALMQFDQPDSMGIECRLMRKDGKEIWVRLFLDITCSKSCGVYIQCIFFDITAEKKAKADALQMQYEMDMLVDMIPGGVAKIAVNQDLNILLASDTFYEMTGYTKEECIGSPFYGKGSLLIFPEDRSMVVTTVQRQIENDESIYVEYRIVKKDGSIAWNTAYGSKIEKKDGLTILEAVFIDSTKMKHTEYSLTTLTNNIPGGVAHIWINNGVMMITYASDGFYRLTGYSRKEYMSGDIQGNGLYIMSEEDRERVLQKTLDFIASGEHYLTLEYRIIRKDGIIRWNRVNAARVENSIGKVFLECVFSDITDYKNTECQLRLSEERYRIIYEQTQDILFEWDMRTGSIYLSAEYEKKFGYALPQVNTMEFLLKSDYILEADKINLVDVIRLLQQGTPYVETDYRLKKGSGEYIWCRIRVTTLFDDENKPYRAIGLISDIDDYKKETTFLQQQAQRDLLTGLLNKITAQHQIELCLNDVCGIGQMHGVLLVDIDNFKGINDAMGHMIGDAVLVELSSRIRAHFKEGEIIGRLGGDEFIVFLPNIPSEQILMKKAEILSGIFRYLFPGRTMSCKVSGSIGAALYPQHGRTFQELYEKADVAMYIAKQQGKDCCFLYQEKEARRLVLPAYRPRTKQIDGDKIKNNVTKSIFEILYGMQDMKTAVNIVLDLAARYYHISHIYIYEKSGESEHVYDKSFEWCSADTPSYEDTVCFTANQRDDYLLACDEDKIFYCTDIRALQPNLSRWFQRDKAHSVVQIPMIENGRCKGIIGFSEHRIDRLWPQEEVETSIFLAKIITVFLLQEREKQRVKVMDEASKRILDGTNTRQYVIDASYTFVKINRDMLLKNKKTVIGQKCYVVLRKRETPCLDCPVPLLRNGLNFAASESYNAHQGKWQEVTATVVTWIDGTSKYLINCQDKK